MAGKRELSRPRVDPKDCDFIRFLISGEEVMTRRIEFHTARKRAAGFCQLDAGQFPGGVIYGKDRDGSRAAI